MRRSGGVGRLESRVGQQPGAQPAEEGQGSVGQRIEALTVAARPQHRRVRAQDSEAAVSFQGRDLEGATEDGPAVLHAQPVLDANLAPGKGVRPARFGCAVEQPDLATSGHRAPGADGLGIVVGQGGVRTQGDEQATRPGVIHQVRMQHQEPPGRDEP